jgi:hypothetical protein
MRRLQELPSLNSRAPSFFGRFGCGTPHDFPRKRGDI